MIQPNTCLLPRTVHVIMSVKEATVGIQYLLILYSSDTLKYWTGMKKGLYYTHLACHMHFELILGMHFQQALYTSPFDFTLTTLSNIGLW